MKIGLFLYIKQRKNKINKDYQLESSLIICVLELGPALASA